MIRLSIHLHQKKFLYTINSQYLIDIQRDSSVFPLKDKIVELNLDVVHEAETEYAVGNHTKLVNLGPIALFGEFRLTNI